MTQKSVKLLRLNLILNNLTHSLPNVKQADLLEFPQFYNDAKNNLEETFDILDNIYNLNDLNSGAIDNLVDNMRYLKRNL